MSRLPYHRMTPWVGRLIVANAVVLLLLMTLTPALTGSLAFDPQRPFAEPWTYITYMFVHGSLWHLALNMLLLFFWGTRLEERMGSRVFLLYPCWYRPSGYRWRRSWEHRPPSWDWAWPTSCIGRTRR